MTTAYGSSRYTGLYALATVVNALAAAGGMDLSVSVRIEMPEYAFKSRYHAIAKEIEEACEKYGVTLAELSTSRHQAVNLSAVTISGVARVPKACLAEESDIRAGQEIVLTKWVGMDGMLRIVDEKEPELKERFAPAFLHQIRSYREHIFALREIDVAKARGSSAVRQVTEGGILAALWDLAKESGMGLELDLKKISILQETIEVCEHYRLNPYQLTSTGCLLIITEDGEALADELKRNQIQASVIGKVTDNNDKMLHNGEEVRYIDRPAPDEIFKIYNGGPEQWKR
jgi:hydrogenase expression/formation protein HypE